MWCCLCVVFFFLVRVGCVALSEILLVVGCSCVVVVLVLFRVWLVVCWSVGVSSWWRSVLCWFVRIFLLGVVAGVVLVCRRFCGCAVSGSW